MIIFSQKYKLTFYFFLKLNQYLLSPPPHFSYHQWDTSIFFLHNMAIRERSVHDRPLNVPERYLYYHQLLRQIPLNRRHHRLRLFLVF